MNVLDLFSGIGGFSKGFENAGLKIDNHFFSEVDKHAIANYKYNFKNAKNIGSVANVRGTDLPKIDIITFGSPCQDFSLAGNRAGMAGQRSSLIQHAIRLIGECQPSFFIWENVKGVFSSNNGEDFWAIIKAFANIGGYRIEWQLLNTKWFLPQNRERVYLIGHLATTGRDFKQVFPIGEDVEMLNKPKKYKREQREWFQTTNFSGTLTDSSKCRNTDTFISVAEGTKSGFAVAKEGDSINLAFPNSTSRRGRVGKECAQTLDVSCNQAVISNFEVGRFRNGFRKIQDNTCPTILAGAREDGSGQPILKLETNLRRLTEIECERLQGFPDNWTKFGDYDGIIKEIPNTQRYKMIGNAVTVAVVVAIASKLNKI